MSLSVKHDSIDLSPLALLTSNLAAAATSSVFRIPPPDILAILITMLVHPSTTNTLARRQSSHYLSRVLDVAAPRAAKFDVAFKALGERNRSEDDSFDQANIILESEGLMTQARSIWDVIEWAFHRGDVGGWVDLINLIVRILANDFEDVQGVPCGFSLSVTDVADDLEERDCCILVSWLRDSGGRKAAINKAIRAITATRGAEMMDDTPPIEIYRDGINEKDPHNTLKTDIWGGSILLYARIEILSMVPDSWIAYPSPPSTGLILLVDVSTLSSKTRLSS